MTRFSTLQEEASENRLVFSDYLCLRKQWFLMNRFKRTRHSIASTKIILLLLFLLLQQRLSDDAWTMILVVASTTTLRARATCNSSSSKVTKLVGGPYIGQGAVLLCSRTPAMRVGRKIVVGWWVDGGVVNTGRGVECRRWCRETAMSSCFVFICVWKRSYLSTRCWGIFRGRCFWWLYERCSQKSWRGK